MRAVVDPAEFRWKRIPIRKRKLTPNTSSDAPPADPDDSLDEYLSDEKVVDDERRPLRERIPRDDSNLTEAQDFAHANDDNDDDDDTFPDYNQDDHEATYIQMEHFNTHKPAMVYGTGYRTMRSFRTPTRRRVNVVCSHTNTPLTPLRSFWSTLSMNILTPDGAVCGFPSSTLSCTAALRTKSLTPREDKARNRYEQRGFTFDSDHTRDTFDFWDVLFFGEFTPLTINFRSDFSAPLHWSPLSQTPRGWLPERSWPLHYPSTSHERNSLKRTL